MQTDTLFDDDDAPPAKQRGMTDAELLAVTDNHIRAAVGFMGGMLADQRQRNEYYYLAEPKGDLAAPDIEGRSSVISTDVADTVEWMLPSLIKTFTAGDNVVEFAPKRQQDEAAALQATDYCNYVLHKQNPGFQILYTWMKDALLQKNGVLKVWWDDSAQDVREVYRGLNDAEAAMLLQQPEVEPIEHTQTVDAQALAVMQNMAALAQAAPGMQQMQPPLVHDIVVRRRQTVGRVHIENVPPEEFLIERNAKTIEDSRFVAHRFEKTISDLRARGYDNVDDIGGDGEDNAGSLSAERVERRAFDDEMAWAGGGDLVQPADESQRVVWVTECYLRIDFNGDGIAEWRQVVRCGGVVLRNVECDGPPFVSICPIPLPHRFFGTCPADQAVDAQRLKTSILRASLDGLYHSINGRTFAVQGQVNLDDLLTSRPGGVVRVNQPGAVGPLMEGKPDLGAAQSMLEYAEVLKENRTGFTRYSQGTNADALNQTATGINIITNRADSRIELIARVFAETGFQALFRRILQLVSQHQDQATVARVNGRWVNFDPRSWATQFDFNVNCGLGTNNKDQLVQHLMALAKMQSDTMPLGLAGPPQVYQVAKKFCEALGFKQPEMFFSDPASHPPQPPKPDPKLLEMQAQQQYDVAKLQLEREKVQMDHQLARERLEAEIALKREQFAMQMRADQEAKLYASLYAQSEGYVDGYDRSAGPAAPAGGGTWAPGAAGAGQPGVPPGVRFPAPAAAGPVGMQPGA